MSGISIVVPIYNAQNYLHRCLKSLINQTLNNVEIILINDGSTDNSYEICQYYAMLDKRISFINQSNKGVSVARNRGLEVAKYEYITFMDPDDEVKPDIYEKMYLNMKKTNCDIYMFNYTTVYKNIKNDIMLPYTQGEYTIREINRIACEIISSHDIGIEPIMGSIWRCGVKKTIIKEQKCQFPINIRPMQDLIFMVNYLSFCKTLYIDKNCYYLYYINENSAMTGYKQNMWENNLLVYNLLSNIIQNYTVDMKERMNIRWINMVISALVNEFHLNNRSSIKDKWNQVKVIINHSNTQESIKQIKYNHITFKEKVILNCIKKRNILLIFLIYILRFYKSKFKKYIFS